MPDSDVEQRLRALEDEIGAIHSRNERVEQDKAWETSLFRRMWLLALTYILTALVFWLLGVPHFLANALIPTIAYWLSTLSLPIVREMWLKRRSRGQ